MAQWSSTELAGGCPLVAAATELDDRPGPVRDTLVNHLRALTRTVALALIGKAVKAVFDASFPDAYRPSSSGETPSDETEYRDIVAWFSGR